MFAFSLLIPAVCVLETKYLSSNCNSSKIYIGLNSVNCLNVKWLTVRAVDADNRNCSNPVDPTS